jgi:hypothetical protein
MGGSSERLQPKPQAAGRKRQDTALAPKFPGNSAPAALSFET